MIEGIAAYLATIVYAAGPGGKLLKFDATGVTGDTFSDHMPSSPDDAVYITTHGGPEASDKLGYDEPNLQLIVRGVVSDPRAARARAQAIYNTLHGLGPVTLSDGTRLISCVGAQSGPVPIGADEPGRYEFSLNFRTEIRALTGARE